MTEIEPECPRTFNKVKKVSIYLIESEKLIYRMNFESVNLLKWPIKITKAVLDHFVLLILLLKPCSKKEKELEAAIDKTTINSLGNKTSSKSEKEGRLKRITEFGKKWILWTLERIFLNPSVIMLIITLIIMSLVIILIPFSIIIWHRKKVQGFLSMLGFIVVYQGIFISLILLFILVQIGKYSLRKDKNFENAVLFSFDILIPIIELDKENLDFILDAAEEYPLIGMYFCMEKLIGPLLISVLLPLLLITGL